MIRKIKFFNEFLNENASFKSLGLGDPVEYAPGIYYEFDNSILDGIEVEEYIEELVDNLKLKSGEIFHDKSEFLVSGITLSGNVIYIEQHGEYDMYGSPYEPKMKRPIITVNGKDVTDLIIDEFGKYYDENYVTNYPNVSNVEPWGHLLDKKLHQLQSRKFGL